MPSRVLCFLLLSLRVNARCRARHLLDLDPGTVELREETEATGKWSGNKVWPGALALLGHLNDHYELPGLKILELGCGLPFLAAGLAALGAEVCATDHPDVIDQVRDVLTDGLLKLEPPRPLNFQPFAWGAELPSCAEPIQLVVGADLVYDGFPVDALYESTTQLLNASGAAVLFALQPRSFPMTAALREPQLIAKFLKRFAQNGWQVSMEPVGPEALGMSQASTCARSHSGSEGLVIATISGASLPKRRTSAAHTLRYQVVELEEREDRSPKNFVPKTMSQSEL